MTIHSLWPFRKLPLYCVTNELAHVLRTEISCWISCMSSSLDSRSIYGKEAAVSRGRMALILYGIRRTHVLDRYCLACGPVDGLVDNSKAAT